MKLAFDSTIQRFTLFLALSAAYPALAGQTTVYPTGFTPLDASNVQAAVALGGDVVLKAVNASGISTAFNFGNRDSVVSTKDVTILGETVRGGTTIVKGGRRPFRCFSPVQFKVHGIRFEGPTYAAVFSSSATNVEVTNNVIIDVKGLFIPQLGGTKGVGIWVLRTGGPTVIADNVIDTVSAQNSSGIAALFESGTLLIQRNNIRNTSDWGILAVLESGPVFILENTIVSGPVPSADALGNGIQTSTSSRGPNSIASNTVVCTNPNADGISLVPPVRDPSAPLPTQTNWSIASNQVSMAQSLFGGITFYSAVSKSVVGQNLVQGNGAFALDITAVFPNDPPAEDNLFIGNNISHFDASMADVFLDVHTRNNVLVGHSGTVKDLGMNNRITGVPGQHEIGQTLREMVAWKHARLKEFEDALADQDDQ